MNKPEKPNIIIPESFAENGVKTDFDSNKILNGFDRIQPDVLAGDNLNKFIDDTYKGLNYALSFGDYIENKVSKSGDTMTGTLIVESGDSAGIQLNAQQLDLTTTPTSAKRAKIQINDVNGTRFGAFECTQNADGSISSSIGVMLTKDDGSVNHSVIGPAFSADGTAYATAPTYTTYTDSSTKIATTAFLKNVLKGNGYGLASFSKSTHGHLTFDNGIIFQWGLRNTTSNTYTLTFPKPFPTRMASIVITAANDQDNSTSEFKVSSITKTGCDIRSSDSTIGFYWFAIGY